MIFDLNDLLLFNLFVVCFVFVCVKYIRFWGKEGDYWVCKIIFEDGYQRIIRLGQDDL